jgi:hypothetical protein
MKKQSYNKQAHEGHPNEIPDYIDEEAGIEEPQEGDYVLSPTSYMGGTSVSEVGGKFLGKFSEEDDALDFVKKRMEKENFYSDVWRESDHGNLHLIEGSKKQSVTDMETSDAEEAGNYETDERDIQQKEAYGPEDLSGGAAIWDALPEADRKEQLKEIGVLKLETSKKEWLELPPITRQRLEEKFKTTPTALEVGKRYKIQGPGGIKEYNLTSLKGNLAELMDDAGKKFSAPMATLESGLGKGQVVEAYSNQVKEYCPDCKIPLRNIGVEGAIQLRDCPRCSKKVSTFAKSPHKNEKRAEIDYPFHLDKDGDKTYELPFDASSIEELISIDDEKLQEFLYSELGRKDQVELESGLSFPGNDVIDFLPKTVRTSPMDEHKESSTKQAFISDESIQHFIGQAVHYLNQHTPEITDFTDDDITYYVAQRLEERIGKPLSPDEYGHVEQMVKSAATKDEVIEEMKTKLDKFYKEDPEREKYIKKIVEKYPTEKESKIAADIHTRYCTGCGKKAGVHSDKAWKDKKEMCSGCFKDYERNEKPRKKPETSEDLIETKLKGESMDKESATQSQSEGYEDISCPHCGSDETVFHQYVDGGSWKCQGCGEWAEDKVASKKEAAGVDEHAARELELYIDTDSGIHHNQTEPLQKLLMKKIKKGIFDFDRSIKAWENLAERAAHKYMDEFGSPGSRMQDTFSKATRLQVAKSLAESFKAEADLGNYDYLLEKPKEGSVKTAAECFCGKPSAEGMQDEEHPLCEEHLEEVQDINKKLMEDKWPSDASKKTAEDPEDDLSKLSKVQALAKFLGISVEDVVYEGHNFEAEGGEYGVYTDEEADSVVFERVKQDLEDDPSMFSQDWLQKFIYIDDTTKRVMLADEESYLRDELWDDEEEIEKRLRDFEDGLDNPIQYFVHDQGMYSEEDLLKQSFISIEINEAAEDAINTDGRGHFLGTYSGDEDEVEVNGTTYFIYRTN